MEFIKEFLFKKINKNKLRIEDIKSLNTLLKTGLSIKNCLMLIMIKNNSDLITKILIRLDSGELVEKVMKDYLPKEISSYCLPLLKTMSFSSSLDLSISFYSRAKENSDSLEKTILYPFVLLFISLTALYLFDTYGLDMILEMLKDFSNNLGGFGLIRVLLRIIVYIFYFGMLLIAVLAYYFSKEKNITLFYVFVSKYLKDSIIHTYFCEEFITLFIICLDLGYKTKDALEILKALHNKPIVSFLAFHLDEKLLQGETLKDATKQNYYDSSLTKFINIAVYTNNFNQILSDYILVSRNRIKSSMKLLSNTIEVCSYIMIGAVIIFIYQVLFLPMQAITNF